MSENKEKVCFLVTPIGNDGSEIRQRADDFRKYIVEECDAIKIQNYKIIRADDIHEPGRITSQIIRKICECELVVADVTGGNPNVYYEIAIRHALGKAIIVCAEEGTVLPFDTRDNRTIFYSMHSRSAEQARRALSLQIETICSNGFIPDSPIAEAQQVIKISSDPETDSGALAAILEAVNSVSGRVGALEQHFARQNSLLTAAPKPSYINNTLMPNIKTPDLTAFAGDKLVANIIANALNERVSKKDVDKSKE